MRLQENQTKTHRVPLQKALHYPLHRILLIVSQCILQKEKALKCCYTKTGKKKKALTTCDVREQHHIVIPSDILTGQYWSHEHLSLTLSTCLLDVGSVISLTPTKQNTQKPKTYTQDIIRNSKNTTVLRP